MNQTYLEKSIMCKECHEWLTAIMVTPDRFEIKHPCKCGAKHIIELDRKTGEIKTLIEKNEEN